jgi:hypothetical protein
MLAGDEKDVDEGSEQVSDVGREEVERVEGKMKLEHRRGSETAARLAFVGTLRARVWFRAWPEPDAGSG